MDICVIYLYVLIVSFHKIDLTNKIESEVYSGFVSRFSMAFPAEAAIMGSRYVSMFISLRKTLVLMRGKRSCYESLV